MLRVKTNILITAYSLQHYSLYIRGGLSYVYNNPRPAPIQKETSYSRVIGKGVVKDAAQPPVGECKTIIED